MLGEWKSAPVASYCDPSTCRVSPWQSIKGCGSTLITVSCNSLQMFFQKMSLLLLVTVKETVGGVVAS